MPESDKSEPASAGPSQKATTKKTSGVVAALVPVVLVTIAVGFIIYPYILDVHERGPQPIENAKPRPERGPNERGDRLTPHAQQLLAGLSVGKKIDSFEVSALRGPIRQRLEVELTRDNATIRVFVVKRGTTSFPPPKETARYAIFYGKAQPSAELVSSQEAIGLVQAVGKVVEANETATPMPAGL